MQVYSLANGVYRLINSSQQEGNPTTLSKKGARRHFNNPTESQNYTVGNPISAHLSKPIFYAIIQVPDFIPIGNAGRIPYFHRTAQETYPDDSTER